LGKDHTHAVMTVRNKNSIDREKGFELILFLSLGVRFLDGFDLKEYLDLLTEICLILLINNGSQNLSTPLGNLLVEEVFKIKAVRGVGIKNREGAKFQFFSDKAAKGLNLL